MMGVLRKCSGVFLALLAAACLLASGCTVETPGEREERLHGTTGESAGVSGAESTAGDTPADTDAAHASESVTEKPAATGPSAPPSRNGTTGKPSSPTTSTAAVSSVTTATSATKPLLSCTVSVECKTLLEHLDALNAGYRSAVGDGVLLAPTSVAFREGESVFEVLSRIKELDVRSRGKKSGAYVQGINNIFEKILEDNAGGWIFLVNGRFLNSGCGSVKVKDGDVIQWHYTVEPGDYK